MRCTNYVSVRWSCVALSVLLGLLCITTTTTITTVEATLASHLSEVESALTQLATVGEYAHNNRCSAMARCRSNAIPCTVAACGDTFPSSRGFTCNGSFGTYPGTCASSGCNGLQRSMDTSVMRFPLGHSFSSAENTAFTCSSSQLDDRFKIGLSTNKLRRWQYIASNNGATRIFPGAPQNRTSSTCESYDARIRPWFISASSGPKDVVIVIDRSASMGNYHDVLTQTRRITAVKKTVTALLGTLTMNDFVSVVAFSTSASVIGTQTSRLVRAQSSLDPRRPNEFDDLVSAVDNVIPTGDTNMAPAFAKAFDLLAVGGEYTSGCTKIILFLTDGEATDSSTEAASLAAINAAIAAGQTKMGTNKAHIFTYSLSLASDKNAIPQAIACANKGVWASIPAGEDPLIAMRGYYQFLAAGIAEDSSVTNVTRWSAPYEDAFGLGRMVSAARPIYDWTTSIPLMVGVVGTDVTMADLQSFGGTYSSVVNALTSRSQACPRVNLSTCQMQYLRNSASSYVCPAETSIAACSAASEIHTVAPCPANGNMNDYLCGSTISSSTLLTSSPDTVQEVSCCGTCGASLRSGSVSPGSSDGGGSSSGVIIGVVVAVVIIVVIVVVVVFLKSKRTQPEAHRDDNNTNNTNTNNNNSFGGGNNANQNQGGDQPPQYPAPPPPSNNAYPPPPPYGGGSQPPPPYGGAPPPQNQYPPQQNDYPQHQPPPAYGGGGGGASHQPAYGGGYSNNAA